jgi:hypothetical protein
MDPGHHHVCVRKGGAAKRDGDKKVKMRQVGIEKKTIILQRATE